MIPLPLSSLFQFAHSGNEKRSNSSLKMVSHARAHSNDLGAGGGGLGKKASLEKPEAQRRNPCASICHLRRGPDLCPVQTPALGGLTLLTSSWAQVLTSPSVLFDKTNTPDPLENFLHFTCGDAKC